MRTKNDVAYVMMRDVVISLQCDLHYDLPCCSVRGTGAWSVDRRKSWESVEGWPTSHGFKVFAGVGFALKIDLIHLICF